MANPKSNSTCNDCGEKIWWFRTTNGVWGPPMNPTRIMTQIVQNSVLVTSNKWVKHMCPDQVAAALEAINARGCAVCTAPKGYPCLNLMADQVGVIPVSKETPHEARYYEDSEEPVESNDESGA